MATQRPYTQMVWHIALIGALHMLVAPPALAQNHRAPNAAPPAAALASASAKRGPIVAEQRKHLRRLTKLEQLRVVAKEKADTQLVGRIDALLKQERERHARKLVHLKIGKKILMTSPAGPAPAKE